MFRCLLLAVFLFSCTVSAEAQASFGVQSDTVSASLPPGFSTSVNDTVRVASGTVSIAWRVSASDFPADWLFSSSICDNKGCYPVCNLWSPGAGSLITANSLPYSISSGTFHMLIGFADTNTVGCHYLTVRMDNDSIPSEVAYETYLICNDGATSVADVAASTQDMILYPNPAGNEINVGWFSSSAIAEAVICNSSGQVCAVVPLAGKGVAHIGVGHLPPGIYFLRLIDASGANVIAKAFAKQ